MLKRLPVIAAAVLLTGCLFGGDEPDRDAATLLAEGKALLRTNDHGAAVALFQEIEERFPFSAAAPEAQLLSGYSYIMDTKYLEAEVALQLFVSRYPMHDRRDYAHYLLGLTYFLQLTVTDRDPFPARAALEQYDVLLNIYPDSPYTKDVQMRRQLVIDHLAEHEIRIAKHYQRRKIFVSAILQYKNILQLYPGSSFVPETLMRLVEAYASLGLTEDAAHAAKVLAVNFADSVWTERSAAVISEIDGSGG